MPLFLFFPSCLNCRCSNYTYSLIYYFHFTFTFMKCICFDNPNKYTYEDRYVFIPRPPSGLKYSIMLLNTRCQPSRHYIFKRGNRFHFWCLSCYQRRNVEGACAHFCFCPMYLWDTHLALGHLLFEFVSFCS